MTEQFDYWENIVEQYQSESDISCTDFHYGPLIPGDRVLKLLHREVLYLFHEGKLLSSRIFPNPLSVHFEYPLRMETKFQFHRTHRFWCVLEIRPWTACFPNLFERKGVAAVQKLEIEKLEIGEKGR